MDLTGPLALLGVANANVAKMVIDDIKSEDARFRCIHIDSGPSDFSFKVNQQIASAPAQQHVTFPWVHQLVKNELRTGCE